MPGHGRLDAETLGRAVHAALQGAGELLPAVVRRSIFGGEDEQRLMTAILDGVGAAATPAPTRRVVRQARMHAWGGGREGWAQHA